MSIEENKTVRVCLFKNIKHRSLRASKKCKARCYVGVEMAEWRVFPETDIDFSSYGFFGRGEFLREHISEMKDEDWIVCPVQLKDYSSFIWDIQIGVTGTRKHNQEPYETMLLEMEEELGLRWSSTGPIQGIQSTDSRGNERTIFKIPISGCLSIEKDDMPISGSESKDTVNKKIACIIHGTRDEIERIVNKSKKIRYYSSNDDNIIGLAFVSVQTVKRRFKIL
jgi:hypothetical protein